ncbi:MAG: hypothetical protein KKE53_16075 [Proteobacteria bacterium]|nr:hypothetical protein [Pseudomonadota bacterium]
MSANLLGLFGMVADARGGNAGKMNGSPGNFFVWPVKNKCFYHVVKPGHRDKDESPFSFTAYLVRFLLTKGCFGDILER